MRRLVIFDFDGTLADSARDIATALNQTLRDAGLGAVPESQVRAWIGNGVLALLEQAVGAGERSPERIAALYGRFRVHYERCCLDTTTLYPGMAECLARLAGHPLAILSNKPGYFLDRIVGGLGLAGRFVAVVGGDATPVKKPDPAAIDYVVRAAGPPPDEVWMVGDSAIDVATGRAAGARTIGCAWGLRGCDELRAAGADFLVEHPAEIPPIVGP